MDPDILVKRFSNFVPSRKLSIKPAFFIILKDKVLLNEAMAVSRGSCTLSHHIRHSVDKQSNTRSQIHFWKNR